MNSIQFEQRLRSYKQQKYKLLIAKQSLAERGINDQRSIQLDQTIDQTIVLVDNAIGTCERICVHMRGIESELKGYQIIEKKLEDVMFENDLVEASTRMSANKLNQVGEHLAHLGQLLKHKN